MSNQMVECDPFKIFKNDSIASIIIPNNISKRDNIRALLDNLIYSDLFFYFDLRDCVLEQFNNDLFVGGCMETLKDLRCWALSKVSSDFVVVDGREFDFIGRKKEFGFGEQLDHLNYYLFIDNY